MSSPGRQDLPLSAIPPPRFPWEGPQARAPSVARSAAPAAWPAPGAGLAGTPCLQSTALPTWWWLKYLKTVKYSENVHSVSRRWGVHFSYEFDPASGKTDTEWGWPSILALCERRCLTWIKLAWFYSNQIWTEINRVGTISVVFSLAQLIMHFLPRVSKTSNQPWVHLHRHYEWE